MGKPPADCVAEREAQKHVQIISELPFCTNYSIGEDNELYRNP